MRNIAVFRKLSKDFASAGGHFEPIELDGVNLTCALIHTKDLLPESRATLNGSDVLVNIKAFSCNYRDKSLFFAALGRGLENSYYVVGSEFVGEVIALGPDVLDLKVGDRVIGNNRYVGFMSTENKIMDGVPSNHASKEFQVFPESKLIRIPAQMPDTIAAAFSLNSQTAYGMLRKLNLKAGAKILVTAAKSNVALSVFNALRKNDDLQVFTTSTSLSFEPRLKELGVTEVIKLDKTPDGSVDKQSLHEAASRIGPFDAVIDAFFDAHFDQVVGALAPGGKYVTCGMVAPRPGSSPLQARPSEITTTDLLTYAVFRNVELIGNCLGSDEDLDNAIRDFEAGSYKVIIDSVHRGDQIASFFDRTFNAKDRFGKVVYVFD